MNRYYCAHTCRACIAEARCDGLHIADATVCDVHLRRWMKEALDERPTADDRALVRYLMNRSNGRAHPVRVWAIVANRSPTSDYR